LLKIKDGPGLSKTGLSKEQQAFQDKAEKKKDAEIEAAVTTGINDTSGQGGERITEI
jgi:hypothetical protein